MTSSADLSQQRTIKPDEVMNYIVQVSRAFSPTAPIDSQELFAGRLDQVQKIISAVVQRGQHVILFGERGVGKTSLATVMFDVLKNAGFQSMESGTINCDATMDFSGLWQRIFRDMHVDNVYRPMGFTGEDKPERLPLTPILPAVITPDDVRYILQNLGSKSVIVIDELDRLNASNNVTQLLADTIKTLSDHSVNSTLILVGVANTVDELIAEHKSVERALLQIQMPRMSEAEIEEILDKCFSKTQVTIQDAAKSFIVKLSKGLPHYTHLLGQHAAANAINAHRLDVTLADVKGAINKALENSQNSVLSAYHKAISSPRDNLYKETLLACALAKTDFLGYFSATDVKEPMALVLDRACDVQTFSRHLNAFCSEERGRVLEKIGEPRSYRFRFTNPLLQPFVILRGIYDGLINETAVERI